MQTNKTKTAESAEAQALKSTNKKFGELLSPSEIAIQNCCAGG